VESGERLSVFVSATTADLGPCRQAVRDILLAAGIFPIAQDHFSPDHRMIEQLITDRILSVDAVICLVGHVFGTQASSVAQRSYTQLEFEIACRFDRPIYTFIATESFGCSRIDEPPLCRELQSRFRNSITNGPRKYEWFSSRGELENLVRRAIRPILAGAGKKRMIYEHQPALPAFFVGRTNELQQLDEALRRHTPSTIAIVGMGGQGKTTLVAQALSAIPSGVPAGLRRGFGEGN